MMILGSCMVGFVDSTSTQVMCLSTLVIGLALMVAYTWRQPDGAGLLILSALVTIVHLFYLYASSSFGSLLFIVGAFLIIAALAVWFFLIHIDTPPAPLVGAALLAKICLIPEDVLNWFISQASGSSLYTTISWVLLGVTSLYAISAVVMAIKKKIVTQNWGIVLGLLQFFFISDILGCAILFIMTLRWREPEEEKQPAIYEKGAFAPAKRRKKKSKTA